MGYRSTKLTAEKLHERLLHSRTNREAKGDIKGVGIAEEFMFSGGLETCDNTLRCEGFFGERIRRISVISLSLSGFSHALLIFSV